MAREATNFRHIITAFLKIIAQIKTKVNNRGGDFSFFKHNRKVQDEKSMDFYKMVWKTASFDNITCGKLCGNCGKRCIFEV
jgi:hypothetical protein